MHHPVGFDPFGSSTFVENKGLLQPYTLVRVTFRRVNGPVGTRGFPEPGSGDPVRPCAVSVFPVPRTVEVPLLLPTSCQLYIYAKNEREC